MSLVPGFNYDALPFAVAMDELGIVMINVKTNEAHKIIDNKYLGSMITL
jgi:hypothetical protein